MSLVDAVAAEVARELSIGDEGPRLPHRIARVAIRAVANQLEIEGRPLAAEALRVALAERKAG